MSTETKHQEQDPVLFIIAGATATRTRRHNIIENLVMSGVVAFEELCAFATRRFYDKLGSLAANVELIVPPHFGLWPFENSYKNLASVIGHKSEKYPDRKKVLIGHSLGGCVAVRFVHEHPEAGIDSTITIGSPFSRLGFPLLGVDKAQLGKNTDKIRELREDLAFDAPDLVHLASVNDYVVPSDSALPDLKDTRQILFSKERTQFDGAEIRLVPKAPSHWGLVSHPETLAACQEVIRQRLAA